MMRIKIKYYLIIAMLIIGGSFLFYGCKKNISMEQEMAKTDLVQIFKEKLRNTPSSSIEIINAKGKGYYGDLYGNKIVGGFGITQQNQSSCPDPGDSEFSQELVSITREYTCNVGYRFLVKYKIISEFTPQLTNGGSLFSRGRIKLVNGVGTQVYITSTSTINQVSSIVNNGTAGTNSNGDPMYEFIIQYRSEVINESTYNLSAAVQSNLTCYTDCSNYATLNIGFSSQQQTSGSQQNTQPCLRVDKVYWNPRNGSTPPYLAGCDPVGSSCFPYGYVYPQKQEIEFLNSSGEWKNFYLYQGGDSTLAISTPLINYWDLFKINVGKTNSNAGLAPGNIQVRYRNKQTGSQNGGPCVGPWIIETWVIY